MSSISVSTILTILFSVSTLASIGLVINMSMRLKRTKDRIEALIKELEEDDDIVI